MLIAVILAFGAALCALEDGARRLEGDAQLVNVDSQKVQQVVVLPGARQTTAKLAGDEPLDVQEELGEGESDSEELDQYLSEEDDAEEQGGCQGVGEEESGQEESDMEEDENEEEGDIEAEDSQGAIYLEDDEEVDLEEKEESEESERHEEGEEDEKLDKHSQEEKPLVNVDAREVHQVVVATPSQEQKVEKQEKIGYIDRRPLRGGSSRSAHLDLGLGLEEVIQAREEMNGQLIDLHHRFLGIKPRTLRNPSYRLMLKKYCSMLESRIRLERDYLDLDDSADDKILRMLQAHHRKLTKH